VDTIKRKKVTVKEIIQKKNRKETIVAIAAYDAPLAAIADEIGFDLLINGNAGPMSLLGHQSPLTVTFDEQLMLTKAVSRVTKYGMVVGHLPYMTYNISKEESVANAGQMIREGGADAVKCEGNIHTARHVYEIVQAGIPVIGHMGMQASRKLEQSGYGTKGKTAVEAAQIIQDSKAFFEAGVFAIILEYVPFEVTEYLCKTLPIPIISVSAGKSPDGIYIGTGDAIGYSAFPKPRHAKSYVNVKEVIQEGLTKYKSAVLAKEYPGAEFTQHMAVEEYRRFLTLVNQG